MKINTIVNHEELDSIPFIKLNSFHWESNTPYRPDTYFKLAFMPEKGFYCALKCFESDPKALYTENDSPIYRDSCVEFFIAPVSDRSEYINVECNSLGVNLCEFGAKRDGRVLVSSLCDIRPHVLPFSGKEDGKKYWGVEINISIDIICRLFSVKTDEYHPHKIRANFFKCGDDTNIPHYIAYSPVNTLPPGFHNPDCFSDFYI